MFLMYYLDENGKRVYTLKVILYLSSIELYIKIYSLTEKRQQGKTYNNSSSR